MTLSIPAGRCNLAGVPAVFLRFTFGVAFLGGSIQADAQSSPYQSPRREMYGTGFRQEALPDGGVWAPRVDVGVQYAGNISLAESSAERIDAAGIEVAPGVYASYSSDFVKASLDYSLISRMWDEEDFNDLSQNLAANGQWRAFGEILTVNADATYQDVVSNPADGVNYGSLGIFGSPNLLEQAQASINPVLRKRFNEFEASASYRHARNWYFDAGKRFGPSAGTFVFEESTDDDVALSLGTARSGRKAFGRLFFESQRTEFERSQPFKYERAGLDAGFQVTPSLALIGDAGVESPLDEDTSAGGLETNFWSAGVRWERDERSSAEVRYGKRFFGNNYAARFVRQMRFLNLEASYTEALQTETRTSEQLAGGALPVAGPAGPEFGVIVPSPYISKDARVSIEAKGSRTTLGVGVFNTRRVYLRNTQPPDEGSGAGFTLSRRLAANLSADLAASYVELKRLEGSGASSTLPASEFKDTQVTLRGNRSIGSELTCSLEVGYLSRSGEVAYDGWWVGLRGRWAPRPR